MTSEWIHFDTPDGWVFRSIEPDGEIALIPQDKQGSAAFWPNAVVVGGILNNLSVIEILDSGFEDLIKIIGPIDRKAITQVEGNPHVVRSDYSYARSGRTIYVMQFLYVDGDRCITTSCSCDDSELQEMSEAFSVIGTSVCFES